MVIWRVSRIRAMAAWRALTAVGVLVVGTSLVHAADGSGPFGGPPPRRSVEERPFGGPPPQRRSLDGKPWGTSCKTPSVTCKLSKSQQVGSACSCPGSDGKDVTGVTESGK
jgi:hypothetical protein